jgi:hypothetical protein
MFEQFQDFLAQFFVIKTFYEAIHFFQELKRTKRYMV